MKRGLMVFTCIVLSFPGQGAWARAGEKKALPSDVVAIVNGQELSKTEFHGYLETKGIQVPNASLERRESLVRSFAVDKQFAAKARNYRLDQEEKVVTSLAWFDRKVLPEIYFRKAFLERTVLTEDDFSQLWQGLADSADARVAILANKAEADAFLDGVKNGARFQDLAMERSSGKSAYSGGVVTGITIGDIRFSLAEKEALLSSSPGMLLGPFRNPLGDYSVMETIRVDTVGAQRERIRTEQEQQVRMEKASREYVRRVGEEMARSEIEVSEEYFDGKSGERKRPYVAWVRGVYIYPRDIEANRGHGTTGKPRKQLEKIIFSIISVDLATREGYRNDPEYLRKRESFLTVELADAWIRSQVQKKKIRVDDAEIAKRYREYYKPEQYEIFLVSNMDNTSVEAARKELLAGTAMDAVARKFSEDASARAGGIVGFYPLPAFDLAVQKEIGKLAEGENSGIFRTAGMYAFIRLLRKRTVDVPPMEDLREEINRKLWMQKWSQAVLDERELAQKGLSIRINRDALAGL